MIAIALKLVPKNNLGKWTRVIDAAAQGFSAIFVISQDLSARSRPTMAEWRELLQSIIIGLIFSYLLAKLISLVLSFKDENLSISRPTSAPDEGITTPRHFDAKSDVDHSPIKPGSSSPDLDLTPDSDSLIAEQGSVRNDSEYDDEDDDWEGVESTELDELFSAATAFVAAAAADRLSQQVSNNVQLQLYALYKIATEGPCTAPQPSALKMTARAKWQVWMKLGALPPEEAMQMYIDVVTDIYPSWAAGLKPRAGESHAPIGDSKGPMGPVFSTFIYEEESANELKMDAIHGFAREGEVQNLLQCIESGVSVNIKDSEGRSPLHWAVDRGHLDIVELLIGKHADVNLKDNEGQTPLHYAAVCERKEIAEYLVKQNANTNAKDDDGNTPCDLCGSSWPWIHPAGNEID